MGFGIESDERAIYNNKKKITASLEYSLKLGIDAGKELDLSRLHHADIEMRQLQRHSLMFIIEVLVDNLTVVEGVNNIIVTDEDGYVMFSKDLINNEEILPQINSGVCLHEDVIGCNAFGLALKHQRNFRIENKQHYFKSLHNSISYAVPLIFEGNVLGCAGFCVSAQSVNHLKLRVMESIIVTAISASLKMLETRKYNDEIFLIKQTIQLNQDKAEILLNMDLNIVQINGEAEIVLNIKNSDVAGESINKYLVEEFVPPGRKSEKQKLTFIFYNTRLSAETRLEPVYNEKSRLLGWSIKFEDGHKHKRGMGKSAPDYFNFKDIVGKSSLFMRSIKLARAIASSPSNVLVTGESGTGKELFAQSIHYASNYRKGNFITLNCAAIPKELMESELFGYIEGAFTGARKKGMQGKFLKADGGTLFLDEIGDMPMELQVKLLRALQTRRVTPLGQDEPLFFDARIISATNHDLQTMVDNKEFRSDLFYRINVIHIHIPSLRDRKDDIPMLIEHFVKKHSIMLEKHISCINPEVLECLQKYHWPGNVRELENAIELAVNLSEDEIISMEDIPYQIIESMPDSSSYDIKHTKLEEQEEIKPLESILKKVEKEHIDNALHHYQGNISKTASALGVGRATLYRKIEKYNLSDFL